MQRCLRCPEDGGNSYTPPILLLEQMPQQVGVQAANDDWTGLNDPAERRKRQNRLHQRTYRNRQRLKKVQETSNSQIEQDPIPEPEDDSWSSMHHVSALEKQTQYSNGVSAARQLPQLIDRPFIAAHGLTHTQAQATISQADTFISLAYMLGSPRMDLLLTLVQFNVFRALVSNTFALGFTLDWLGEDAISPFIQEYPNDYDWRCPASLRSTALQRTNPHHPWIDLFPIPSLRDNLLSQGESFDDDLLCYDLVEVCHTPCEQTGLIVWGSPWDVRSWEVTEDFARKWPWMLKGCQELLLSTNYWREKRGEDELLFEI